MSARICADRTVIVTGAARGLGREYALAFAAAGASVLVNDTGGTLGGAGTDEGPAGAVVTEITALGGQAVASCHDVSDEAQIEDLIGLAVSTYGRLDVIVNNAGILRDRSLVNMTTDEWDDVVRVHLRGTFLGSRAAASHWRERFKADGKPTNGRIINVSSASGLYGNFGQSNYGAAKAGIAAFTVIVALELARYGVTVNAVAPGARTRMTIPLAKPDDVSPGDTAFDYRDPANVAPLVVWLGSEDAHDITGRVFNSMGGEISVAEGWHAGPTATRDGIWPIDDIGAAVRDIVAEAAPPADMFGRMS